MNRDETITIGKITGAHGVRGDVKFQPYGGLDDFAWGGVYLIKKQGLFPCKVTGARRHKETLILSIDGCGTIDDAGGLAGIELCVAKSELPPLPEGEFYEFELIGKAVWTDDNRLLGNVTGIIPTGGNDVMEVLGKTGTILIPVIADTVLKIDIAVGRITVRLMEGLEPESKEGHNP